MGSNSSTTRKNGRLGKSRLVERYAPLPPVALVLLNGFSQPSGGNEQLIVPVAIATLGTTASSKVIVVAFGTLKIRASTLYSA